MVILTVIVYNFCERLPAPPRYVATEMNILRFPGSSTFSSNLG